MHNGKVLKKADPSTIQDKLLVGYQGWFTCAGDGEPVGRGHHGWLHWFDYPVPDGGRPNTDIWPDVSEYDPSELYEAPGLRTQSGEKCHLFSSRNQKTVDRHFNWMAQHGVDGAFLQRFAGQCDMRGDNDGIRRIRDEVGDRVREAAEKNNRVYAIMYDVSGVPPEKIEGIIKYDWKHLVFDKRVFDSPSYLREKGKPVVALWGFGFEDSRHTPGLVRSIVSYINNSHPGGVYLMAGVPAHWRTSTGDADRNPEFVDVWLDRFDAISPWTIGRYGNIADADRFAEERIAGDVKLINERNQTVRAGRKLDYIPVVFPGGSGYNLSEGKWSFNGIPREGGRFLWRQIYNARSNGVRTIYGAMWDEYDEGTAFMPIVTKKNQLPLPVRDKYRFLAPDADNYDLPADWYMRICGMVGEVMRGDRRLLETFPHKELQDYWGSRPRYEDGTGGSYVPTKSTPGASGSVSAHILAAEENPNEPPPPPYTLEDKSPSTAHEEYKTAPTSPDQLNYNVLDLTNDISRHKIGGSSHPPHATVSPTAKPPSPVYANKPSSSQTTTPLTTPPLSSYFLPPSGPPRDAGTPSIPLPQVSHGSHPHHQPVNLNTPFHWDGEYPNPQSQPPGGYIPGTPVGPWNPQETPFQPAYQPGYGPPPPLGQHTRPPINLGTKPTSPQSPQEGMALLNSSASFNGPPHYPAPQSTYPGQVGPDSYFGYDQKTDGKANDPWGGPPTSAQGTSPPYPAPGYPQPQSSYPGMANTPAPCADHPHPPHPAKKYSGPPPVSNSPPLPHGPGGYGQFQPSYPCMTSSPGPVPLERPPTRPPTSNSQHGSSYPGMTNPPALPPTRPPTSHSSRPTTPHHQPMGPSQTHPPLPGGYNFSGPGQSTYGGMNPSASPPPPLMYQQTGPGSYGYQQQQSTYPGHNPASNTPPYPGNPGTYPPPSLPPRRQDRPPSRPSSSSGPSGPGYNQTPHQHPYSAGQQPPQSYGGPSTGLSYSASTSSSYYNATASWKKQQTGVIGLAKDTVDKLAGKETRKNVQAQVQNVLKPFMK